MLSKSNIIFNIDNIKNDIPTIIEAKEYPTIIKAKYSDDLNILKIHEAIIYKFGVFKNKINDAKAENIKLTELLKTDTSNEKNILLKISENLLFINNNSNDIEWNTYYNDVEHLLKAYIPLATDKIKGIININSVDKEEDSTNIDVLYKRLEIIDKYLLISQNYIYLDIICTLEIISNCQFCDKKNCNCYNEKAFNNNGNILYKNNNYNVLNTFIKALNKYEGNYSIFIPESVYSDLDVFFLENGFQKGTYYKNFKINSSNNIHGISLQLLINALTKTNNSTYYHIINIIAFNYWGWEYPNLSNIRDKLIEHYKLTQEVYDTIKERDSNLNINIRIYAHLKSLDYDCEYEDFKMLTTRNALIHHNKMLKIMFETIGLKYVPII